MRISELEIGQWFKYEDSDEYYIFVGTIEKDGGTYQAVSLKTGKVAFLINDDCSTQLIKSLNKPNWIK